MKAVSLPKLDSPALGPTSETSHAVLYCGSTLRVAEVSEDTSGKAKFMNSTVGS
jgi:hypothetical protein